MPSICCWAAGLRLSFDLDSWISDFSSDTLIALRTSENDLADRVAANIGLVATNSTAQAAYETIYVALFEEENELF